VKRKLIALMLVLALVLGFGAVAHANPTPPGPPKDLSAPLCPINCDDDDCQGEDENEQ